MAENLTVITERLDDIPVLLAVMEQMGLSDLLDKHFPTHGNWTGLSGGRLACGWLAYILSEANHRLNQVESWAANRLRLLQASLDENVQASDFTDDRLASWLNYLSADEAWRGFEAALNRRTLRVYDLQPTRVHIDGTTASGYWGVTDGGLFQFGHSKDHRPDLAQIKVMQAVLDPLGMPVATWVVSGEQADDGLYLPLIAQVREGLARPGLLYVGDCKMMALATRGQMQAQGDFYLGPLSRVQMPEEKLDHYLQPVWQGTQPLTPIERLGGDGVREVLAEGYECAETVTADRENQRVTWVERRLIVRSGPQAAAAEKALQRRLTQAPAALEDLTRPRQGKRRLTSVEAVQPAVAQLIADYQVAGLLSVSYQETRHERAVRPYGTRPAEVRVETQVGLHVQRNEDAIRQAVARLGWRVYGTNHPAERLSLTQAVLAYREEYLAEHSFGRLKGKPLSLTPMYLQDDRRATGLVRLLTIGQRLLTLVEFTVRRRLAETNDTLAGVYASNPTRATARPSAETLLAAFKEICLTIIVLGPHHHYHITPLSDTQRNILSLLGFSESIYLNLLADSFIPP